jgi:hypothetical protein
LSKTSHKFEKEVSISPAFLQTGIHTVADFSLPPPLLIEKALSRKLSPSIMSILKSLGKAEIMSRFLMGPLIRKENSKFLIG